MEDSKQASRRAQPGFPAIIRGLAGRTAPEAAPLGPALKGLSLRTPRFPARFALISRPAVVRGRFDFRMLKMAETNWKTSGFTLSCQNNSADLLSERRTPCLR